jgi:hypothetical protein
MTPKMISAEMLGAGIIVIGLVMLWVRSKPDRNSLSRTIFSVYAKTTHGVSVQTYLLTGGLVLVTVGLWLLLGFAS